MAEEKKTESVQNAKRKRKTHRSPAHPYFNLEDSIIFVSKLYDADGLYAVPVTVASKNMGFDGSIKGGVASRALGAVKGYGLVDCEGVGEKAEIKPSDLARKIILDTRPSSPDRKKALQEAALNYKIIEELSRYWPNGLPSDEAIRSRLLINYEFNERAVRRFVNVFRETYEFAHLNEFNKHAILPSDRLHEDGERSTNHLEHGTEAIVASSGLPSEAVVTIQRHSIPLIGGGVAIFEAPRPLSKQDYSHVKKWFELMEPALSKEAQDEQTQPEQEESE